VDARELLAPLIGRTITTVTGRPNTVVAVGDNDVIVATSRSPAGTPIPIRWVQDALDRLEADGDVEISVDALGFRSAFVGAALLTVPGVTRLSSSPPRLRLSAQDARAQIPAEAAALNAWWEGDVSERYWLEITDRVDLGVDLHAPQRDASGKPTSGYSLIWRVQPGDLVFHYDKNARSIHSWSRAVGGVTEAPVIWLSHRATTRRRIGNPIPQPGWWLDLDGPFELERPLTLSDLRARAEPIRRALTDLQRRHAGALYFPFFFYGGGELRPMQPYLNKLPAAVVTAFPELAVAVAEAAATEPVVGNLDRTAQPLGVSYRLAAVSPLPATRDAFTVDPAIVERGLRGHADTQNALAASLELSAISPRSPRADEPNFDLAWEAGGAISVAEVKSTTPENEERQLRLGLGQVLRYRQLLEWKHRRAVRGVLVAESRPRDESWRDLCVQLGVLFTTPEEFGGRPWTDTHPA